MIITKASFRWVVWLIMLLVMACIFKSHLQDLIDKLALCGAFTPWGFLLLYCLASVLCLPTVLVVLAGGVLFGPVIGTLLNLLGATLGAACNFCLVRYLRQAQGIAIQNRYIQRLLMQAEHRGWKAVAFLRLTPAIPYNLVNYGLGLTRIKLSHYLIATFIFLIPNKIIMTCCGYYGCSLLELFDVF